MNASKVTWWADKVAALAGDKLTADDADLINRACDFAATGKGWAFADQFIRELRAAAQRYGYPLSQAERARVARIMPGGVPRWIRCYDNGGETVDRYTVVYSGRYPGKPRGWYQYVAMSAHPFHPQGFGQHGENEHRPIDVNASGWPPDIGRRCHLGRRIRFADLPPDCQKLVLSDYRELWHLPGARQD